jgi:ADP-ribosylglycohydrolase
VAAAGLITVLERPDRQRLAERMTALTHGHIDARLTGGAMAELVDRLRHGATLDDAAHAIEQRLLDTAGGDAVQTALARARRLARTGHAPGPEAIAQLGKGWTAPEALSIAVFCALTAESFEHGVLNAVNHAGDSDATGTLTGELLGSQLGVAAVPSRWRERLELRHAVDAMADDLADWFAYNERRPSPDGDPGVWPRYPGW